MLDGDEASCYVTTDRGDNLVLREDAFAKRGG
jgi:hypothetical protein